MCSDGGSGVPEAKDPNGKTGPSGFGTAGFITSGNLLPYRIDFENDASATAPAQRAVVTDQLDANIDWNSLQFTEVGFGDIHIAIPAGSQYFFTTVPVTSNDRSFQVYVELSFDSQSGLITAVFQSLDAATGLPPDVLTGFLPPEDGTGRGQGYLTYTLRPRPSLPTGTRIKNIAIIHFDGTNEFIATNQVDPHDLSLGTDPAKEALNTIDAGPPTSSVSPLPAEVTDPTFTVSWSGQDDPGGSGIASFDIYVSVDGGTFEPWLVEAAATSSTFIGEVGHTYAFSSVARDNVGHFEAAPDAPDAQITVLDEDDSTTVVVQSSLNPSKLGDPITFTAIVSSTQPDSGTPTGSIQFQIDGADFGPTVALVEGSATSSLIATLAVGTHSVTAAYIPDSTQFEASTGTLPGGQAVLTADSTTSVTSSSPSSTYGQSLTFTATVSALTPNLPTPTGSVQFRIDGADFGPSVVLVNGSATSPALTTLGAGSHTVTALYLGDANFTTSAADDPTQTVTKAHLIVTADDQHIARYDASPTLTYTLSGFVNGETAAVVSGRPVLSTAATSSSPAGRYAITPDVGTLSADNYDFASLVNGTLTVHPKVMDVRVRWGSRSMSILGLNRNLPFEDITAIDVLFSDDMNISSAPITLTSRYGGTPRGTLGYQATTHTATFAFPTALAVDRLMLELDRQLGAQVDSTITLLDDFRLGLNVLSGDYNGDGIVTSADVVQVRNQMTVLDDSFADINGDGRVDDLDFNLVRKRLGLRLPPPP